MSYFSTAAALSEYMAKNKIIVDKIYSAPFLRCVQTADELVSGMKAERHDRRILVEPGLYDYDTPGTIVSLLMFQYFFLFSILANFSLQSSIYREWFPSWRRLHSFV